MAAKIAAKDYSRDPYHNDWMDPEARGVSTVAMQAQGMRLPPQPAQQIQPYPMGVSIIQDPHFMNDPSGPVRGSDRRSLRDIKPNSNALQLKFEDSYAKPNAAGQSQLDQLYFRAGSHQKVGSRIDASKDISSQSRVLGLDGVGSDEPVPKDTPSGKRINPVNYG